MFSETSSSFSIETYISSSVCHNYLLLVCSFYFGHFLKTIQISGREIYPLALCTLCRVSVETICENKFTFRHKGVVSQCERARVAPVASLFLPFSLSNMHALCKRMGHLSTLHQYQHSEAAVECWANLSCVMSQTDRLRTTI